MADPKKFRRGSGTRMSTAEFADKMRVEAIAKRLEKNALGELRWSDGEHKGKPYFMNDSELRSAESILSRAIPKLTAATNEHTLHAGDGWKEVLDLLDSRTRGIPSEDESTARTLN